MPISLIVGPPNAGRVGEVVTRLRDALDREPVLVVPSADDAARFERELCAADGASVGATVSTFDWLVESLVPALGIEVPPRLSGPQRLALVRTAMRQTPLRVLRRSAQRPGFAPALDTLISELQAALVSPAELAAEAADLERGEYETELADLYAAYVAIRDAANRSDAGSTADAVLAGLRSHPAAWRERPVLVYGFDDLTRMQLELVATLASACEVTVSVTYADRRALAARATMLTQLRDELGAETAAELPHDPGYTHSAVLAHLDRHLFEPHSETREPDGGLVLLESAGDLGEAEAVGIEIARLLASGEATPDQVAVVVRHPDGSGPAMGRVLERLGIPVAVDARIPLPRTAVGHSLLALCRAAGGSADALLEHLRTDPATPPGIADSLERTLARGEASDIEGATGHWKSPPRHLARLRAARSPAARMLALARSARELAEGAHRRAAPLAGERSNSPAATPMVATELRAGVVASELLEELAAVADIPGCEAPDLADAIEAIEGASVRAWQGPSEGRVRIIGPYRARSLPLSHLFVTSLQEGEFPGSRSLDPLLGEERRSALGIAALRRREQADEERYLFHACVSRPTRRLYVCWRSCDDEGAPLARSPFIDEVLDLVAPDPAGAEEDLKRSRGLENAVVAPWEATTARELARSLAVRGLRGAAEPGLVALEVPAAAAAEVELLLSGIPDPTALPGPLSFPAVIGDLDGRRLLSASSLEGWLGCSYRWFVEHELQPERLEPTADPMWVGGVVHRALRRLYAEAPGDDSIPRPNDVGRWKERFGEVLAEEAGTDGELGAGGPRRATALARAREQVEAFLESEAASETELRPRPDLLERQFGFEGEDDPGALKLGDELTLRGSIDRIDVAPDGRSAVIRDYKASSSVPGAGKFADEGKLQLPLYMLAAREQLDLEPIAGLYQPLGGTKDRRPRGMALAGDERLDGLDLVRKGDDLMDADAFDEELTRARQLAVQLAARMRAGDIARDPLGGTCPRYCTFQAICRLERAVGVEGDGNGDDAP